MVTTTQIVGLVGGTGWPGTRDYYALLNQLVQRRLGGMHGLELRLWSFNFQDLLERSRGEQSALDNAFADAARGLQQAGAQLIALASNTGHLYLRKVLPLDLPLVHIATACALAMAASGVKRAGVLATQRALKGGVFDAAFTAQGIQLAPPADDVASLVDEAIFSELEQGIAGHATQAALTRACKAWAAAGVHDVLLGCTEIRPAILANVPAAAGLRLWDSTLLHCTAIVDAALNRTEKK